MSKALGTILGRPAGAAGAARATPLGFGLRARAVAGRRTQIDRAHGSASARGKRAGHAAVDWTESLALGTGLATLGATDDGRADARSGVGHRRHGFSQAGSPLGGSGAAIFGHAGQDGQLPGGGEPASGGSGRKYHPGLAALLAGKLDAGCRAARRRRYPRPSEVPDQVATGAGIDRRGAGLGFALWGGVGGRRLRGSHGIPCRTGDSPPSLCAGHSFHREGMDETAPAAESAGARTPVDGLSLRRAAAVRGAGSGGEGPGVEASALARRDQRLAGVPLLRWSRPARARFRRRRPAPPGGLAAAGMAARRASAHEIFSLRPAGKLHPAAAGAHRQKPLEDRTGLSATQGGTGAGPLRRPQLAGWHHHVTLVMLAHAFLTLEKLRSKKNFWVD